MVLMTLIARVADALPLAASMQEDEQVKINRRDMNAISVSGSSDLISDRYIPGGYRNSVTSHTVMH